MSHLLFGNTGNPDDGQCVSHDFQWNPASEDYGVCAACGVEAHGERDSVPSRADATSAVAGALGYGRDLQAGWDRRADKYGLRHGPTGVWAIHSDVGMSETNWTALRAELILRAIEAAGRASR